MQFVLTRATFGCLTGLCTALVIIQTPITRAQENQEFGRMWTFEDPPIAYLEEAYGFRPNQEWLDALRLGSLRLGNEDAPPGFGSASFVSPNGLILTSAQCVSRSIESTLNRKEGIEIINNGFVASVLDREFRLRSSRGDEWLTAAQLVRMSNVTHKVNNGISPQDDETQAREKREANKNAILAEASKTDPELVPEIVSLYHGAIIYLYQYKVYNDIRLVFLPHVDAAQFGGSADSFSYPRFSFDFALLRAYEDNKPLNSTNHYFKWKPGGATKNELVFVSGTPHTTSRFLCQAQLAFERDLRIPMKIEALTNSLGISSIRGSMTWEQIAESLRTSNWNHTDSGNFVPANMSRTAILDKENGIKAVRHKLHGLKDPTIMAKKSRADMDLQRRVMAVGRLAKKHGDLWQRIDGVVQQRRLHEAKARFHTPDASPVLDVVVAIVRMCDPSEKEVTRIQARKKVEMWAGGSISPNGIFIAYCLDHMVRARKWLPENDPYLTKVLAGQSAAEYWNATSGDQSWNDENWLGYPEPRMSLVESGWNGIKKSKDPIVIAARELATLMRKNEELSLRLDSEEQSLKTELAHALLSCYGDEISPDATGTLRFSDGVVKQVDSNRSRSPYRTTFYGLYDRNAGFDNERPFSLPRTWLDRKDSIDMTKPINFISTNDTTIGNTGSVVVNKALEVVGVVIDGNMESLRSEFVFDNEAVRTVSVHVDGIMEALVKIYDAQHLARELTGRTIE